MTLLKNLTDVELENMYEAGAVVLETMRVLQRTEKNVVSDIMRFSDTFYEWEHIPTEDVYDFETHSQYYYHAHEKDGGVHDDEHGHFHTFLRAKGMPENLRPVKVDDFDPEKDIKDLSDINSHIIGIGMDGNGLPMRLFTTNRWVTADTYYKAEDIIQMIDLYNVDHTEPSWPVNLWVTNMIRLFKPQIIELLKERDITLNEWKEKYPDRNLFEDRELEVTSLLDISIEEQLDHIEEEMFRRNNAYLKEVV